MIKYLDFKEAKCKDCYRCLRECPVKAIAVINHQARIIEDKCILCGTCTLVCPQNAKMVHSAKEDVKKLLSNNKVIASVAPSFVSSLGVDDFNAVRTALQKLGFYDAEETAAGAKAVAEKYKELLNKREYKNFITSSCPAVNNLIQKYYPKALDYLAKVDTPMIAHAKMLKIKYPNAKIVFIGPCIAKKKEAYESAIIDGVLTYEDLAEMLKEQNVKLYKADVMPANRYELGNKARNFPIARGIIKSIDSLPEGYEYLSVDGLEKCMDILSSIDKIENCFLELNACEYACINGPCSLTEKEYAVVANGEIRKYAKKNSSNGEIGSMDSLLIDTVYYPENIIKTVSESEIKAILAKTNKFKKEDELNCGACGYSTCREKAAAVALGYADVEMCLPYMREKAETMSYEIIHNNPNGIVIVDDDLIVRDINIRAVEMLGIKKKTIKGEPLVDFYNPTDFVTAMTDKSQVHTQVLLDKTHIIADTTVSYLKEYNVLFGIFTDITEHVKKDEILNKMRLDTLKTTDAVIEKQMRVAQEIASLLGETTAETKVALVNLKKAVTETEVDNE